MTRLHWSDFRPSSLGFNFAPNGLDMGALQAMLAFPNESDYAEALSYLKTIANKYGRNVLVRLLTEGADTDTSDDDTDDSICAGIDSYFGDGAVGRIMEDIDNPDLWETSEDVNGDGDTDIQTLDTNDNGTPDTAIVTADSDTEEKEAVKTAKDKLGLDGKDKTSTGKTKEELDDETLSDEKQKDKKHPADCTCAECKKSKLQVLSDVRQKNIIGALLDHRF